MVAGLRGLGKHSPALRPQAPGDQIYWLSETDCARRWLGRIKLAGVDQLTGHRDLLNGLVLVAGRRRRLIGGIADLLRCDPGGVDLGGWGVGRKPRRGDFVDLVRRGRWHRVRLCVEICNRSYSSQTSANNYLSGQHSPVVGINTSGHSSQQPWVRISACPKQSLRKLR